MKKTKKITLAALLLAALIVMQYLTAPLGQFVTGSIVNLILIIAAVTAGMTNAIVIAVISPFLAKAFGIGPAFIQILPVIAVGNTALVIVYALAEKINTKSSAALALKSVATIVVAALVKFLILSIGVSKLVLPFLSVPPQKAGVISAMFGINQLITASIGGAVAMIILPVLKKLLNKNS